MNYIVERMEYPIHYQYHDQDHHRAMKYPNQKNQSQIYQPHEWVIAKIVNAKILENQKSKT